MSQTTVNLGYVLINRGEYVADPVTKYYKDNVVQYLGSAFIAAPVDYDEETNPLAYVTVAPYDTDPNQPNEGWKVFASDAAYVNSFMFFTENPEWVYVVCDKEGKILFGVKQDGEFYFGAGCPSQVKEYVEQRISEVSPENYEQVIAFLQDYLGSDTTLKMIIDALDAAKLDKEGLDADALAVQSITESPEYLQVTTDSEDKILEGLKKDGTKVIGADLNVGGNSVLNGNLQVLGSLDISGATYSLCQSPEWIKVLVDSQDRIIAGVRTDGSVYINKIEGLDSQVEEIVNTLFSNKSTLDKFSESGGNLLWNGSSIEGDGISQAEADVRYATKSLESTVDTLATNLALTDGEVRNINRDIDTINDGLSALTSPLPSGAIAGDNVWTGSNQFMQAIIGVSGTNDNNVALYGQFKNSLHRNVDVSDYGADPSKTASENVAAINNALLGGNKTVTISKPGIYLLNAPILIYSNTELICSKGVILKKGTNYSNVIRNIGAETRTIDTNIILRGINIDCDNKFGEAAPLSSPLYACRGQIMMYYVEHVKMYDITVINSRTSIYMIQLCHFYDVIIDGFYVHGGGDGVHIDTGSFIACKNGIVQSGDDAIPLLASDWLGSGPEVGNIHDCLIENITEVPYPNAVGYFTRNLIGKWVDWFDGMEIVHGDKVVSNGHTYRANCNREAQTFISHTQPSCDATVGTEEDSGGFTWVFVNSDAIYEASIYNVTYRNIISKESRPFICGYYELGSISGGYIFDRSVYPTVSTSDYPTIKGVYLESITKPHGSFLQITKNMYYHYTLKCINEVTQRLVETHTNLGGYLSVENCDFTHSPKNEDVYFTGGNLYLKDCIGVPDIYVKGKLWSNCNIASLTGYTTEKGSICIYNDEPYFYDGNVWKKFALV